MLQITAKLIMLFERFIQKLTQVDTKLKIHHSKYSTVVCFKILCAQVVYGRASQHS
jgi:hypothetical protein